MAQSFATIGGVKTCAVCRQQKREEYFAFNNKPLARRHSVCKVCKRAYSMKYYRKDPAAYSQGRKKRVYKYRVRNREIVTEYLSSHPCVDCGEHDALVLEFDHVQG